MIKTEPNIFSYTDFRVFLKDTYNQLKSQQPSFSHRYFSQKAGFASPNFLKLVMDGKRNLSPESVHKFAGVLKLNRKEHHFFELLVQYGQATDPGQKQHYYQEILTFPEYRKVHYLEKELYTYLSRWYQPAILELVQLADFQEDPAWIAQALRGKITPKEARSALDTLLQLGLLERSPEGRLKPAHPSLTTGEEARSLAAFSFHENILEEAKEALSQQDPDQRDFAAITMALNPTQLLAIKEMIRDLRKRILNYLAEDGTSPIAVYQFSLQLFSLTNTESKKENKQNGDKTKKNKEVL